MKWCTAVTTVPSRRRTTLPDALRSIQAAGFHEPWIVVDGDIDRQSWVEEFGGEVIARPRRLGLHGSWVLTAHEMLIREPQADMYAVFQDDVLASRNLRQYLELAPLPSQGYRNLILYPGVEDVLPPGGKGWYSGPVNRGKGAQALVFDRDALVALLSDRGFVERCLNVSLNQRGLPMGQVNVDGGIATAMQRQGYREFVHFPSLVTHAEDAPSAIGNRPQPRIRSWRGESFDCLTLLPGS